MRLPTEGLPALTTVTVHADFRSGTEPQEPDLRRTVVCAPAADCELSLPAGTAWELALDVPGLWMAPQVLTVGPDACGTTLTPLPTGTVSASLSVPKGDPLPEQVSLRFQSTAEKGAPPGVDRHEARCELDERAVSCILPVGSWDLRLRATGYVSHYFRQVSVAPGSDSSLGSARLQHGSSVVGWVTTVSGPASPRQCRVRLEAPLPAVPENPEVVSRSAQRALETAIDDRGFFHLRDVPVGTYRLTASQPGFAPAVVAPLRVLTNAETELREPIVLLRPAELHLLVDPPIAPDQQPWHLFVLQPGQITGHAEKVAEGRCGPNGAFTRTGIAPGPITIEIQDSRGSVYLRQDTAFEPGAPPIVFDLPVVRLEGRLSLGKQPLAASLRFIRWKPAQEVRTAADEDGRFEVVLPGEGTWKVAVSASIPPVRRQLSGVEVKATNGKASVRLTIPDSVLEGAVRYEDGTPASDVSVNVLELIERTAHQLVTDTTGRFTVRGLDGEVQLVAEATRAGRTLTSDTVQVTVTPESSSPHANLVLREKQPLAGRLVDSIGSALAGAFVLALPYPSGTGLAAFENDVTDVDGTFAVDLPGGTQQVELIAMAPGHALTARWVTVSTQEVGFVIARDAGTIVIEVPPDAVDPMTGLVPVLFQDGAMLDLPTLGTWSAGHGRPRLPTSGRMEIPGLAPGNYRLCLVPLGQVSAALATAGRLGVVGECAAGSLFPGGVVSLNVVKPGGAAE